jgi:large subunit ribosomal protein L5
MASKKPTDGPGEAAPKAERKAAPSGPIAPPRLKARYRSEVVPALMQEFGYKNAMAVPRLSKIVINMGVGEASTDIKILDKAVEELAAIAGQRPAVTRARKSIANFKIREGMPIGAMVTLRGNRMYEFFDRFVSLALPRVRDFRGVPPRSFDGRGNYTLGVRDQLIFQETDFAKVQKVKGMNLCIVTTARTDEEARGLLAALGLPFRKEAVA